MPPRQARPRDAAGTLFDLTPKLELRLATAVAPELVAAPGQAHAAIERADTVGTWPEAQTDPEARLAGWTTTFIEGLLGDTSLERVRLVLVLPGPHGDLAASAACGRKEH